jgi:hypothetical protein
MQIAMRCKNPVAAMGAPIIIGRARQLAMTAQQQAVWGR